MAQPHTAWLEDRYVPHQAVANAVGRLRVGRRATRLGGALVSVSVGVALLMTPGLTRTAVGILLAVQFAVQGLLQLFAAQEARVPRPVRWILGAGGLLVLFLAFSFFRGHADSVFLLGLWMGFGLLLRGFTMSVSMTPSTVGHVVAYDDLLNAVIVSAGLFMTAFPFSSLVQLAHVAGFALIVTGLVEAVGASRRRAGMLRPLH
ncbi:DUF308 domain-containing protein [Streptomyces olivaceoviridis]